ncbi:protein-S-isoprenylcysteine O-methyltransferase [Podospora australis]|uniref:Protein-S-isoprenylcysteine O-methyltransferase n=1 Tax=Podospora australis TaxID=1536484 RepID=A0AAN6WZM3_9PEZI|nr:protein-S-isoprenylcysteine O-methyltransferase [Podospora australis]
MPSLAQTSLASAILASTIGTYIALQHPNPNPPSALCNRKPPTKHPDDDPDSFARWHLTDKHFAKFALSPLGLFSLCTIRLVLAYPPSPSPLSPLPSHLNPELITWSPSTFLPLFFLLGIGIPLRLASYRSLGKDFTFALAEPTSLKTDGLYRWVQHPSYTAVFIIIAANVALVGRTDGVMSTWVSSDKWYSAIRDFEWAMLPVGVGVVWYAAWTRVRQEEKMLRQKFGKQWEDWHRGTGRFLPWLF